MDTPATPPTAKPVAEPAANAEPLAATTSVGFLLRVSHLPRATVEQLRAARQALEKLLDAIDEQLTHRPEAHPG